jgi:hypothetical protein
MGATKILAGTFDRKFTDSKKKWIILHPFIFYAQTPITDNLSTSQMPRPQGKALPISERYFYRTSMFTQSLSTFTQSLSKS